MASRLISHYRILKKLGVGGMGEVYLARDTTLDRDVALKLIREDVAVDKKQRRRFLNEARAASALSHQNVAHIYEIGEENGAPFIAMEYVRGTTLDSVISEKPLDIKTVVDIGIQLADALDGIHSAGLMHRDIKPGNVIVSSSGHAKVLDFGLAKGVRRDERVSSGAATRALTQPGMAVGTAAYMSPEQLLDRTLDHRTDIFSLSIVLYEMTTGRHPFHGATRTETLDRILHSKPDAVARFNYEAPSDLEHVILKGLEKEPDNRYQSAREMLVDLKKMKREWEVERTAADSIVPVNEATSTGSKSRYLILLMMALILIVVGGGALFTILLTPAVDRQVGLAVLPLMAATGDLEDLSDGITENLINGLSQLPSLRVIARQTAFSYKGQKIDLKRIGQDLKVETVVLGRLDQRNGVLTVQLDLVNVPDGSQAWGDKYSRPASDFFDMQQEISRALLDGLKLRLTGDQQSRVLKKHTQSIEAYRHYIKGRRNWDTRTEEGLLKALEHFRLAVEEDPDYGQAYAALADTYVILGDFGFQSPLAAFPKAKEAALRALEIDNTLAEAHAALAFATLSYDWNWPLAEREFLRAIDLRPSYETAHHWYGNALVIAGRGEEGLAHLRLARELNPHSFIIDLAIGWAFYFTRQYDRAIEQFQLVLERDPEFAPAYSSLGWAYGVKGMHAESVAAYRGVIELRGKSPVRLAHLARALAGSGRREEANKLLLELTTLADRTYVPPYYVASIHTALGQTDDAFRELEKSYEERSGLLVYLNVDPVFDPLRSDPRFADLQSRVGLPF